MSNWMPSLRPESGHLLHLDALRLIASAGIVIAHSIVFLDVGPNATWPYEVRGSLVLLVDMFFVISGFVIAFVYSKRIKDARSYWEFLRRRLARLAPLHWLTLVVFVAIGMFARAHHLIQHHDSVYDLNCIPVSLLFLNSTGACPHHSFNTVSWSISAEMIMYLLAPVFFWIMRRSKLGLLAVVLISMAALIMCFGDGYWLALTYSGGWLRAVPSFALGALLYSVRDRLALIPIPRAGFWLAIGGYLAAVAAGVTPLVLLLILYATVALGIGADARQQGGRLVSALAAGGQLTYSSYMLHLLVVMVVLTGLADRTLHTHGVARNLLVLMAFAIVWPVSYLSLVLFERPAREWLGGRRRESDPVAQIPLA